jgi:hypothetical protein
VGVPVRLIDYKKEIVKIKVKKLYNISVPPI